MELGVCGKIFDDTSLGRKGDKAGVALEQEDLLYSGHSPLILIILIIIQTP